MTRWKYGLAVVVLVSRLAALLLCYVSEISDWCWNLFVGGWFVLLFVALWSLVRFGWRELAIFSLVLVITAAPAFRVGEEPIARLQDGVFRLYALYRIRSVPLDQFLSKCKLIDYVDDAGTNQQVGQCDDGLRSIPWLLTTVIYDPSGQFALPEYRRTITWRLAVQGWTGPGSRPGAGFRMGQTLAGTDGRTRIIGISIMPRFILTSGEVDGAERLSALKMREKIRGLRSSTWL